MRQKTGPQTSAAEKTIKDIRRAKRKHHSAEGKSVSWRASAAKTLRSDSRDLKVTLVKGLKARGGVHNHFNVGQV